MVTPTQQALKRMFSLGFFDIFIFALVSAITYAILRRSKLLGESPLLNGIISLSVGFMVMMYPIITGVSITSPLITFLTQASLFLIMFVMGMLIASLFYPNLLDWLPKVFVRRSTLWAMVALALALFVTSGLMSALFFPTVSPGGAPETTETTKPSMDVSLLVAGVIIMIVVMLIGASVAKGE